MLLNLINYMDTNHTLIYIYCKTNFDVHNMPPSFQIPSRIPSIVHVMLVDGRYEDLQNEPKYILMQLFHAEIILLFSSELTVLNWQHKLFLSTFIAEYWFIQFDDWLEMLLYWVNRRCSLLTVQSIKSTVNMWQIMTDVR